MTALADVADAYVPDVREWRYDWYVPWFVAAAVATIAVAAVVQGSLSEFVSLAGGSSSGSGPATGSGQQWQIAGRGSVIIILEIGAIMGVYAGYQRLPEWLQDILRENVLGALGMMGFMLFGYISTTPLLVVAVPVIVAAVITGYEILEHYEVWWPVHNLWTVIVAGGIGGVLALLGLGPALLVVAVLALLDPLAVHLSGYMVSMGRWGLSAGLPVAVVVPEGWQVNIGEWAEGDWERDDPVKALGNGDLLLPAAVAVAANAGGHVTLAPGLTLLGILGIVGAIAGITLTTGLHHDSDGPEPAMPAVLAGLVPPLLAGLLLEMALVSTGVVA